MIAKTKPRSLKPETPSRQRYSNIVPKDDPVQCPAAKAAAAKFRTKAPSSADLAALAAIRNSVPGALATPQELGPEAGGVINSKASTVAPQETWSQAFIGIGCSIWLALKLLGRALYRSVELIGQAVICVVSPILTAMVDGIAVLVFVLTIYELWTPAKFAADQALQFLMVTVGGY